MSIATMGAVGWNNKSSGGDKERNVKNWSGDVSLAPSGISQNGHDAIRDIVVRHQKEAEKWLSEEQKRSNLSYLREGPQYVPLKCSKKNSTIPIEHIESAYKEYNRRFGGDSNPADTTPSVLLVATGVSKEWVPGEEVGHARFLLFPELGAVKMTALFVTYMPGPEHGAVAAWFAGELGSWQRSNQVLNGCLSRGGQSSGGYGFFQPDKRIFPFWRNRDHAGRDTDRGNKNNPYSRFIWEIEYENRDAVQIRERGRAYMIPHYTRLFLAMKIYAPSDGRFEAAVVLWGKEDEGSNAITVMKAVSFGSIDLSDDHKQEFFQRRADLLVGVDINSWERPQNDANAWSITLPFRGFLFKVTRGEPAEAGIEYVLDDLGNNDVEDFVIDLRGVVNEYENQLSVMREA